MRATLPIGIALLATWMVMLAVGVTIGNDDTQRGLSIGSAVFGSLASLVLTVTGINDRRARRR